MTLENLCGIVGDDWVDAKLLVPDERGRPVPVTRVSLHRNDNGGIAILLHEVALSDHQVTLEAPEEPEIT